MYKRDTVMTIRRGVGTYIYGTSCNTSIRNIEPVFLF